MGLTLIAILTAALLLPGIIAARSFYQASRTDEVEPSIPALSTTDGIALVGLFSVAVHLVYVAALRINALLPAVLPWPVADPYRLFTAAGATLPGGDAAFALFFGLGWLCVTALIVGFGADRLMMHLGDRSIFYGPLAEVIARAEGDQRYVVAYVLSKMRHEGRIVGYQGTVVSLLRDDDRFPSRVVLKSASLFSLDIGGVVPVRHEHDGLIDWIALAADDWENIAFRVFELADDVPYEPADDSAAPPPPSNN